MLGGTTARADVAAHLSRFRAVRINHRDDLAKQTSKVLKTIDLDVESCDASGTYQMSNLDKLVKPPTDWETPAPSAYVDGRALVGAHIALWRQCADGDKPLVILEDGLLLPRRLPQITTHLTRCIERVSDVTDKNAATPVMLILGANAEQLTEHWLPTDMQQPSGEKVVLREVSQLAGAFAYVVWPSTAKRLLASLPVASPVDAFFNRHLAQGTVRALLVHPGLAVQRLERYAPAERYAVLHKRVAVRSKPLPDAFVEGTKAEGEVLYATGLSEDGNWIKLGEKEWAMIEHPTLGKLLDRLAPEEDIS